MRCRACLFLHPWRSLPAKSRHSSYEYFHDEWRNSYRRWHATLASGSAESTAFGDYQKRVNKLQKSQDFTKFYPRLEEDKNIQRRSPKDIRADYSYLKNGEVKDVTLRVDGRILSHRSAGSKLIFYDVSDGESTIQALCNLANVHDVSYEERDRLRAAWRESTQILRRGDWISITGHPSRTSSGELSIAATRIPQVLATSLHQVPKELTDLERRSRSPHVDLIVNRQPRDTLRMRHHIEKFIREFLESYNLIHVRTPVLSIGVGGATARPFTTLASEFPESELALRIAPELFLKRLLVGGMEGVYEMGQAFRNEGIDTTHNPEFTTCEFYKPFATLEDLIKMTEDMFAGLAERTTAIKKEQLQSLDALDINFSIPFKRLEFIPAIEAAIGRSLPDLSHPNAQQEFISIFHTLDLEIPASPSLPRLLDALSSAYLEPQCTNPTFITHHPECLSPLSKSFYDPHTGQRIAARVELFINSREYVNAYEEENSPFEQRRKFEDQLRYRQLAGGSGKPGDTGAADSEGPATVDESYLEALEWGLPPTGGWGCGVDRICMLFAGASRISDVLSFGNLRNVMALAQPRRR
ncbi:MAG: hypothetical protein M1821_001339 [Bathelium mastoideum]|nr:MAG: hypothetical protein M1821_001339 [Bathelium mastoideum]KAI9689864.1 MAG: hypothetical protein M1822_009746 [Bathelium mastoideum]